MKLVRAARLLAILGFTLLGVAVPLATSAGHDDRNASVTTTWDCTGTPCPWGARTTGQAAVWPTVADPVRHGYGYTVSDDVYARAGTVAGWTVAVTAGHATLYAGAPTGSPAALATLNAGQSFTVPATLGADDVVSLRSDDEFDHVLTARTPHTPGPASTSASVPSTWDCTGTPCPWGERKTSQAAVWPAAADPVRHRYGYTLSHDVYARAAKVAGWTVTITAGHAILYAGTPTGSPKALATLNAGQSFTVPATLDVDDLVSLESAYGFYEIITPSPPPRVACTDPTRCNPVSWVPSRWRYSGSGTNPGDWDGGVITWPSWSAFSSNSRKGVESRVVYSASGAKLYPYMGAWADGCEIKVISGSVLIIEWRRGRDDWRETAVAPGDTYTIDLKHHENSAMIETPNNSEPFEVALSRCTPRRVDKGSST